MASQSPADQKRYGAAFAMLWRILLFNTVTSKIKVITVFSEPFVQAPEAVVDYGRASTYQATHNSCTGCYEGELAELASDHAMVQLDPGVVTLLFEPHLQSTGGGNAVPTLSSRHGTHASVISVYHICRYICQELKQATDAP
jgi:hypothetical protein